MSTKKLIDSLSNKPYFDMPIFLNIPPLRMDRSQHVAEMPSFKQQMSETSDFLHKHRKILLIATLGIFLFFWYEIRPIQVNNGCMAEAGGNARELLGNKAEVATDPVQKQSYTELANKNMYLRSDYESFYSKCLRRHGINL